MKRFIALLLAAIIILGTGTALAAKWTCPECGKTGNTGAFCPDCGSAKPGSTSIKAGDRVYLGRWEQNDYTGDGAEKIRWIVLDVQGSKLFLLSEKALACLPFNKKSDGTAWAGCSLRMWLNNDFYNSAFSKDEKKGIKTTQVEDTREHTYYEVDTASRFSGTCEDKVFLLSYLEARELLSQQDAYCEMTAVVSKHKNRPKVEKSNGRSSCIWWLRTSAYKKNAMTIMFGSFSTAYEHHPQVCVRPALWADASVVTQ